MKAQKQPTSQDSAAPHGVLNYKAVSVVLWPSNLRGRCHRAYRTMPLLQSDTNPFLPSPSAIAGTHGQSFQLDFHYLLTSFAPLTSLKHASTQPPVFSPALSQWGILHMEKRCSHSAELNMLVTEWCFLIRMLKPNFPNMTISGEKRSKGIKEES